MRSVWQIMNRKRATHPLSLMLKLNFAQNVCVCVCVCVFVNYRNL